MRLIFSTAPTWQRLRSKIHLTIPIPELADERIQISPGLDVEEMPALALPDEFDRIKKTRDYTSLNEEAAIVQGGLRRHLPTIAYRYRNALLADGTVYVRGGFETIASCGRRPLILDRAEEYPNAMICADIGSDLFFGRWLCDALAKELLASELGLEPINQRHPMRIHEEGYRSLLGLHAHVPTIAHIENMLLVDDRGYNQHHVRRFLELRARMRARAGVSGPKMVYLGRGLLAATGRGIQNGPAVQAALRSLDVAIINPEDMSAAEIHGALSHARIVIAVEGSALAHAQLAMPAGGAMIAIQPSNRFSTAHKSAAEAAGIRFGYVIAQARGGGLTVDIHRLVKTIELVSAEVC